MSALYNNIILLYNNSPTMASTLSQSDIILNFNNYAISYTPVGIKGWPIVGIAMLYYTFVTMILKLLSIWLVIQPWLNFHMMYEGHACAALPFISQGSTIIVIISLYLLCSEFMNIQRQNVQVVWYTLILEFHGGNGFDHLLINLCWSLINNVVTKSVRCFVKRSSE